MIAVPLSLILFGSDCDPSGCIEIKEIVRTFIVPQAPSWTPDGYSIAFAHPSFSNIKMVDVDGTNLRSLLEPFRGDCRTNYDHSPSVSPDGTQVVFVTRREGEHTVYGNFEIATVGIDGSGFRRLTKNKVSDINPVWSPDGSRIAFLRNTGDGNYRLYIMARDGTDVRGLTPSLRVSRGLPVWSPDGSKLAFLALEGDQEQRHYYDITFNRVLYTVGADGSGLTRLGEAFGQLAWSPDGNRLAFARIAPESEVPLTDSGDPTDQPWDQLVIASSDGSPLVGSLPSSPSGVERELIPGAFSPPADERYSRYSYLSGITWSPDGSEIWFIAPSTVPQGPEAGLETRTLYAVGIDGSGLRPMEEVGGIPGQVAWSPDKTKIALYAGVNDKLNLHPFALISILTSDGAFEKVLWND